MSTEGVQLFLKLSWLSAWQGPQVEYSLRAIPLGGYVGFPDDDPESPFKPDDPDLLRNKARRCAAICPRKTAAICCPVTYLHSTHMRHVSMVTLLSQDC